MNNADKESGANEESQRLRTCESAEPNPSTINLSFATTHSSVCPQSERTDRTHIGGVNEATSLSSLVSLAPTQSRFFIDSRNIKSVLFLENNKRISTIPLIHLWFATDQITNYENTTEMKT